MNTMGEPTKYWLIDFLEPGFLATREEAEQAYLAAIPFSDRRRPMKRKADARAWAAALSDADAYVRYDDMSGNEDRINACPDCGAVYCDGSCQPNETDQRPKVPSCPRCGNNRQVWVNQITGKMTCHRAGCHTELEPPTAVISGPKGPTELRPTYGVNMKIPELKPCPFCGGRASMVRGGHVTGHPRWYKAYCTGCQNRTWEHPRKKNAVAAWNTRAT